MSNAKVVEIDYENWRGERAVRRIVPANIYWGSNEWHKNDQWLMDAFDLDRDEERTFAMAAITSWRNLETP